jgi:VanZ family protein
MLQSLVIFLDPLLRPSGRTRWLCLLLLLTLATTMLLMGSRPGIEAVIPSPPWDKLAHLVAFGGFASLAWVVLKGNSQAWPVAVAGLIALMDEGMQYYSPGRSADVRDLVADLTGALLAVLVLKFLRGIATSRRRLPASAWR